MGGLTLVNSNNKVRPGLAALRPEELSKMFPTPPSHEPNPISSPIGLHSENSSLEGINEPSVCIRRPQENYPGLGSPLDELIEVRLESNSSLLKTGVHHHQLRMHLQDWSYVFKPPNLCKMLGSSKYAPLSNLPSYQLPPLTLPKNYIYKASWQCPPPPPQQQQQQQHTHQQHAPVQHPPPHQMLAGSNIQNLQNHQNQMHHLRPGLSPISPAHNSIRGNSFTI
jgi:mediator of RNA polymerase II transcription subunit 13